MKHRFFSYKLAAYFFAMSIFLTSTLVTPAFSDDGKEDFVKAAFIVNFIKFIEWPDGKSINKQAKIDVCVIGDSGIIKTAQIFSQASSSKLSMSLVSDQNIRNVSTHCHVLFISESEESRLPDILATIKGQPVLTISDGESFIDRGCMIGFANSDGKIKLEINRKATESAGIKIDSQLLEIALRVIDK
jgi:hypothetical protein